MSRYVGKMLFFRKELERFQKQYWDRYIFSLKGNKQWDTQKITLSDTLKTLKKR